MERDYPRTLAGGGAPRHPESISRTNANAYAERFARSIKEECLDRLIPFGERQFDGRSPNLWLTIIATELSRTGQRLIDGPPGGASVVFAGTKGLGGLLNYYAGAA